ncbi:MAG TPA: DUF721 domain-containing protein [Amaricoccus sp.]|uniref:DUF721 domain-containing protein n=1 Tax=Amaricoccus sp. TaxID=1872485 RepID=UPI002B5FFEA6|nr:DUF721 domain-containing protein [Amaricoccus sp.]HMQ92580.1 DUF721 domain-containing protein [Amaricoccus sp.]HMR51257.1 DUF721 domain-containing protein [Amaricoccus sp.]HMR60050.1 DUF721 domain-containing protein [Amaricoccus sp.]HMT97993.1 DUF721 domain-containing protein [Amaricoccus sp.]
MADDPRKGKQGAARGRRGRGFTRAGGLIAPQMRTVAARRGFLQARLQALWPEIAGAEIARLCRPAKLVSARGPAGGLLTLEVAPALGPQVQMMLPQLRERIEAVLGPGSVGRIQLVPARQGFAEPPAAFVPAEAGAPPADLGAVAETLSSIGDDDLRRALETLARNVITRRAKSQ